MAGASGARRIVLNRAAFDAISLATADGLFETAKAIVDGAHVPDAAPLGLGLIQGGGALAYVGRKRVNVYSKYGATSVKKPRGAKLSATGITVVGGYGFPGRFVEEGTVKMRAEPFLTPAVMANLPAAEGFIKAACIRRRVVGGRR
jgi:hypothetical protein